MFLLRIVCGDHKGEYYSGFDSTKMSPIYGPIEKAEKISVADVAGHIMAMIDGPMVVAVPECLVDTPESELSELASLIAEGMFQNPSSTIKDLIQKTFRKNSQDNILPQDKEASDSDYMSVWEWLTRSLTANDGFNS